MEKEKKKKKKKKTKKRKKKGYGTEIPFPAASAPLFTTRWTGSYDKRAGAWLCVRGSTFTVRCGAAPVR